MIYRVVYIRGGAGISSINSTNWETDEETAYTSGSYITYPTFGSSEDHFSKVRLGYVSSQEGYHQNLLHL